MTEIVTIPLFLMIHVSTASDTHDGSNADAQDALSCPLTVLLKIKIQISGAEDVVSDPRGRTSSMLQCLETDE